MIKENDGDDSQDITSKQIGMEYNLPNDHDVASVRHQSIFLVAIDRFINRLETEEYRKKVRKNAIGLP